MDREKVIKGLECLAQKHEQTANPCSKCDYHDRPNFAFCVVDVATDALALLKEQKHGEWIDIWSREDPDTSEEGRCSVCKRISERPLGAYCKWCGAYMGE